MIRTHRTPKQKQALTDEFVAMQSRCGALSKVYWLLCRARSLAEKRGITGPRYERIQARKVKACHALSLICWAQNDFDARVMGR